MPSAVQASRTSLHRRRRPRANSSKSGPSVRQWLVDRSDILRRPHLLVDLLTHVVCGAYVGRERLLASFAFFVGLFVLVRLHRYNATQVTRFEQQQHRRIDETTSTATQSLNAAISTHVQILVLFAALLFVDVSLVTLTVSWLVKSDVYTSGHGSSASTLLAALHATSLPALLWCSMARYCVEAYDSFLNDARASWTRKTTLQTSMHACAYAINVLNGIAFTLFAYESASMRRRQSTTATVATAAVPILLALTLTISGVIGITRCVRTAYRHNTHAARLVATLPKSTSSPHDDRDRCCLICREDILATGRRLPCSHAFHADCLQAWLAWKLECPTCRASAES